MLRHSHVIIPLQQLAINFTRIVRGFVVHQGHTEEYYNVLAEFTQIFGSTLYILQTFVGDAVAVSVLTVMWKQRFIGTCLADLPMLYCLEQTPPVYPVSVCYLPC